MKAAPKPRISWNFFSGLRAMISAEGCPAPCRQARADVASKRRFSSVTRTVISPGWLAEPREAQTGTDSATTPAATPAVDNFRNSRLVLSVDILPLSNPSQYL